MIQTILVVESPNDAAFYKKLHSIAEKDQEVSLLDIVQFEDLHNFDHNGKNQRGYSLPCLIKKLENIYNQLDNGRYKDVNHIAVIVDIDNLPQEGQKPNRKHDGGRENRLYQISEAINQVFKTQLNFEELGEGKIVKASISLDEDTLLKDFYFSCFLTKNSNNEGELEYLLMELASTKEDAHHANCLFAWRDCLKSKNIKISDKVLFKLWVDFYIRYHPVNTKEKSNAELKLHFPFVMEHKGEEIFKFDHTILKPFYDYFSQILIKKNLL